MSDDISSSGQFVNLADRTVLRYKSYKYEYSARKKRWLRASKPFKVEDIELSDLARIGLEPWFKEITVTIAFIRQGLNETTLKTHEAMFKRDIYIKIPKQRKFRYTYMTLVKIHSESDKRHALMLRHFNTDASSEELNFTQAKDYGFVLKWASKPQRISKRSFKQLQKEPNFVGLRREQRTDTQVLGLEW